MPVDDGSGGLHDASGSMDQPQAALAFESAAAFLHPAMAAQAAAYASAAGMGISIIPVTCAVCLLFPRCLTDLLFADNVLVLCDRSA